jgi:uncharacterized Zn-binding protein involved in type VI secretion
MTGVARQGDTAIDAAVSTGTATQSSVYANGIEVHRYGDPWNSHEVPGKDHEGLTIAGGCSTTVFVEGKAVAMINSTISCGAVINQGSTDVFVS